MEKIEKFLNENRWRLVDLFKDLDKNKDWRVKRDDLIRECRKGRLEISESMIDELITVLGSNAFKINYKSLARGRSSHLSERRSQLRGKTIKPTLPLLKWVLNAKLFSESRESVRSSNESESDEELKPRIIEPELKKIPVIDKQLLIRNLSRCKVIFTSQLN